MGNPQRKPTLDNPFPALTQRETRTVAAFATGTENETAMSRLMAGWAEKFVAAPPSSPWRQLYRAKLFNVAGIFRLLPAQQFISQLPSLTPVEFPILHLTHEKHRYTEIHPSLLRQQQLLTPFLSLAAEDGHSYLDELLEADHRGVPFVRSVLLKQVLTPEIQGAQVSGSAEPLTRTILIRTSTENGSSDLRDPVSIAFDIVFAGAYLRIIPGLQDCPDPNRTRAEMYLSALRLATDAANFLGERYRQRGLIKVQRKGNTLEYSAMPGEEGKAAQTYLAFITEHLIIGTEKKIRELIGDRRAERVLVRFYQERQALRRDHSRHTSSSTLH